MTRTIVPNPALESLCSPCLLKHPLPKPSKPIKLGILASGSGSNFEAIAQAIATHQLAAQVEVMIYNNPDAKALQRAQNHHIPAQLLNHRDYPSREALDQAIADVLHRYV
jgi:phosphoribosylglycinamide formyltransferase 1